MAKELSFETFFDTHNAEFAEYLSRASVVSHSDKRYLELSAQLDKLYKEYPKITDILDLEKPCALTQEECSVLIKMQGLKNALTNLEMEQVYFKGCADCAAYLKRMKLI